MVTVTQAVSSVTNQKTLVANHHTLLANQKKSVANHHAFPYISNQMGTNHQMRIAMLIETYEGPY